MNTHRSIPAWQGGLFVCAAALLVLTAAARTLVECGNRTTWTYLDTGLAPAQGWREAEFDDSCWKAGSAPLGYGDARLGTALRWGPDAERKFITTWFRLAFVAPALGPGERLVLALCADDGAAVCLNGRELGRVNLPDGPLDASTPATRALSDRDEGFYLRLPVPAEALRPGTNTLAVEVHQCNPLSSDLFFDLALMTAADASLDAAAREAARATLTAYRQYHCVGPGVTIPDGYQDGGRAMALDRDLNAASRREILIVDRTHDAELRRQLSFARSPELLALPPLERAARVAAFVDEMTTPPGGFRWVAATCAQMEREFAGRPIRIGDWIEQAHTGVCRHRSLLFKLLADEAGLKTALVRGNYDGASGAHVWNELVLDDGRRLLVDVMMRRGKQAFGEVDKPEVALHYLTVTNTPWYGPPIVGAPAKTGAAP